MADATAVKRALRALAYDNRESTDVAYRRVIEDAVAALSDVDDAAQFRETQGLPRLRSAVRTATRRGDRNLARDGRRGFSAFEAYREAAASTVDAGGVDANADSTNDGTASTHPTPDRVTEGGDVHFRSGHGTSLPVAGQGGDR